MKTDIRNLAAAALFGVFALACSDGATDPTDDIPRVELLPSASAPALPAGNLARCYTNLNATTLAADCPVIVWNDVTYWVLDYDDGRNTVNVVAYNTDQDILGASQQAGTSQIYEITVSEEFETVRIFGKDGIPVIVPWSVLLEIAADG